MCKYFHGNTFHVLEYHNLFYDGEKASNVIKQQKTGKWLLVLRAYTRFQIKTFLNCYSLTVWINPIEKGEFLNDIDSGNSVVWMFNDWNNGSRQNFILSHLFSKPLGQEVDSKQIMDKESKKIFCFDER